MNRFLIAFPLALIFVLVPLGPMARGQQPNATTEETRVKADVAKRADKKENRVKVKLRNGSEVKGRITQTAENSFTLTDEKTGARTDISYTDVQKLEGRGMSKKAKIAIIAGATVGTFIALVAIAIANMWD